MFFGWNWGRCLRRRLCCSCGHWSCWCSRLCPAFHVFTWQARLQYATAWHLEHWRMGGFNALPHTGSEQFKNPARIVHLDLRERLQKPNGPPLRTRCGDRRWRSIRLHCTLQLTRNLLGSKKAFLRNFFSFE